MSMCYWLSIKRPQQDSSITVEEDLCVLFNKEGVISKGLNTLGVELITSYVDTSESELEFMDEDVDADQYIREHRIFHDPKILLSAIASIRANRQAFAVSDKDYGQLLEEVSIIETAIKDGDRVCLLLLM